MSSTGSVVIVIALLALFLISIAASRYAITDNFTRTRFIMTALFLFIVLTLSISFWSSAMMTFPYTAPAFSAGLVLGYVIGVRTEQQKLLTQGIEHYMEHFAHIETEDVKSLTWWTILNYYSIMGALILINLVGFTNVILKGSPLFIIVSSVMGAALIGSIVPYLIHLWTVRFRRAR